MFNKVLVANRGEIAVRILRTLRELSIRSVAVHSDVDSQALHVLCADEAVLLGEANPAASYLNADRIIEAAKQTGAEAIHPGYGFLSENAAFAKQVAEAGLTFIGPPAEVIAKLGDKPTARRLLAGVGVPIVPGMDAGGADPAALAAAAEELGYPVLIKAAAGGGGKGMRVVESADALADAATQAASEAKNAFGDGTIYLEKYLPRPRHVEVQILADSHGNVIHLFERECSIQRRHQKIIEETPSPALNDGLRRRMGEAAVAAAKAVGYENAGTVEFLLDASGEFYFLEVNTRLQVEHPITELTVGVDLVRHQLEIAAGGTLALTQDRVQARGHALECRIYAEDPAAGFMPSPGTVLFVRPASGPGVRFDSGIYSGAEVPVHYDPILGKLIVWAEDRPAAIARMIRALEDNVVLGVQTATGFLIDVLNSEPFARGDTHTRFLEDHFSDWQPSAEGDAWARLGYVAAELTGAGRAASGVAQSNREGDWPSPWQTLGRWDSAG
ncbi:MAG: acetyl-CoA carboxylase biotin carboxylase subunit [bacterium]